MAFDSADFAAGWKYLATLLTDTSLQVKDSTSWHL